MMGIFPLVIMPALMALANVIPLLFGIYKVDEHGDLSGVLLLSALVWLAQMALAIVVTTVFTGAAALGLALAGMQFMSGFAATIMIVGGIVSFLTTFAILGFCHMKFVSKEVS